MNPSKRTQNAQNEVSKLEDRARHVADKLDAARSELASKTAALGPQFLDAPDQAERTSLEINALELKIRGFESAQSELVRRMLAAQDGLRAAQKEDARSEIVEIDAQLQREFKDLLTVVEDWHARLRTAGQMQARVVALRSAHPGALGTVHDFATIEAVVMQSPFEFMLQRFLEFITPRRDESPETRAVYDRLWPIFYGEQARLNQQAANQEAQLKAQRQAAHRPRVVMGAPDRVNG